MFGKDKEKLSNKKSSNKKSLNKKSSNKNPSEMKEYISGAGGTIVSKSILSGKAKLKWLFRDESEYGNGWVAFGDTDTQEYVNNVENMEIVDFNTLANIEPTVVNVFYMPVGSDLEFCSDKTGKYFVDTKTGKEIREPVKHPAQIAFEKNLKFLNQESYPVEFFQMLFTESDKLKMVQAGVVDFPTGEVVLADPLSYLGTKYETVLDRRIPAGSYPVELSLCLSQIAGVRIAAAKLRIADGQAERYEIAVQKGGRLEDLGKPNVWTFFGVDAGLACFADVETSKDFQIFIEKWEKENSGKNKYTDYFAALFQKSREANPELQRGCGDFLQWQLPETGQKIVFFTSGMGDGIFSGYWGMDGNGEVVSLVIPFMNPEYF